MGVGGAGADDGCVGCGCDWLALWDGGREDWVVFNEVERCWVKYGIRNYCVVESN